MMHSSLFLQFSPSGGDPLLDSEVLYHGFVKHSICPRRNIAGIARFGKEEQIRIFRAAGYRAGVFFAQNHLDLELSHGLSQLPAGLVQLFKVQPGLLRILQNVPQILCQLTAALVQLEEFKIGVLRIEETEEETGKMVLTISEDADCSGLPAIGETVCNYDEGFLAGLLTA